MGVLHWYVSSTLKRVFPILALCIFSSMLGIGILAPILPIYAESLGASGVWLGVIFSGYAISRTFVMPFIGRLSDRRGRKPILAVGLVAFALTSFAYVLADSVISLFIIRLLQGATSCLVQPIAQAYVGDLAPEGEEGKWMGYCNGVFFLGWGSGPLTGGILTDFVGMNSAFYVMGGLNLLAFIGVLIFLPESEKRQKTVVAESSYREALSGNVTRGVFSYQMGNSGHRAIVQTFLPVFDGLTIGLSQSLVGTILSVLVIGAAFIQIPGGKIADRFDKRLVVFLGGMGVLVSMVVLTRATGFWMLLGLLGIALVGDATSYPSASALIVEEGRKYGMGMAMAIFNISMSIGMSIAPILAGWAADVWGIRSAFYFAAFIMLVFTFGFAGFTRKHTGSDGGEQPAV